MRVILTSVVVLTAITRTVVAAPAWQVPAAGPPLDGDAVLQLGGKSCWGFFDRGNNSETARGAVFIRFAPSTVIGDFWRKMGRDAEAAANRNSPDGYDYVGKTTAAQLAENAGEITFKVREWSFDWFIRPSSPGNYNLRAVGSPDVTRGAIGELHCK